MRWRPRKTILLKHRGEIMYDYNIAEPAWPLKQENVSQGVNEPALKSTGTNRIK